MTTPGMVRAGTASYPEGLVDLEDPPDLYLIGGLAAAPGVAVVGEGPYDGLRREERMLDTAWKDPDPICHDCDNTKECLIEFTQNYDQEYSFIGNNCHDFVNDAMAACGLIAAPFWPIGIP